MGMGKGSSPIREVPLVDAFGNINVIDLSDLPVYIENQICKSTNGRRNTSSIDMDQYFRIEVENALYDTTDLYEKMFKVPHNFRLFMDLGLNEYDASSLFGRVSQIVRERLMDNLLEHAAIHPISVTCKWVGPFSLVMFATENTFNFYMDRGAPDESDFIKEYNRSARKPA